MDAMSHQSCLNVQLSRQLSALTQQVAAQQALLQALLQSLLQARGMGPAVPPTAPPPQGGLHHQLAPAQALVPGAWPPAAPPPQGGPSPELVQALAQVLPQALPQGPWQGQPPPQGAPQPQLLQVLSQAPWQGQPLPQGAPQPQLLQALSQGPWQGQPAPQGAPQPQLPQALAQGPWQGQPPQAQAFGEPCSPHGPHGPWPLPTAAGGAAAGGAAAAGAAMSKKRKKGGAAMAAMSGAGAAAAQPVQPGLWKWTVPELSFMLDGAWPYRKAGLTTVLDLYGAYYEGCPTDCARRMPPWIDLFTKHGPKDDRNGLASLEAGSWYPGGAAAKQLTQRMWELRNLHRWCILVTCEYRGKGLKEAAEFWAGKTKQTLKPLWEDVVQHLVEEPALFKEFVAVNPAADWRQAFTAVDNAAGGAAGASSSAGPEDGPPAKNVLFLWLRSKAAETSDAMTLAERMREWFSMSYADRKTWKDRHKAHKGRRVL